jgi:hypothetical protein
MLALLMPWAGHAAGQAMDLGGDWAFQLDQNKAGLRERWFSKELTDEITLPGSTDEAGFGTKSEPDPVRLTREHRYVGPAWYQKTIEIPESWQGKHVELLLERAMWETRVWLDDHYLGMQDSLCVPHRFALSDFLMPGKHRLTLRIDNRLKINVGHEPNGDPQRGGWARMWAMSLTEESQGNWNGVIGRIELQASDPVWVERVETHPDLDKKQTRVTAWVRSRVGAVSGELKVSASCGDHTMAPVTAVFRTKDDAERSARDHLSPTLGDLGGVYYERRALTRVDLVLPFGEGAKLWDEFSPDVYQLKVELSGSAEDGKAYRDVHEDSFGLRKFVADGSQLKLNGRTVFLRGNQDNCIHSKTAYPPMTKAEWLAFWQKHKDHGLNNMRFHSWCPPKAAFEAADELGMFVHVEGPLWEGSGNVGHLPDRANFIRSESERILDEYGNHPSFVMMAPGNELRYPQELFLQHLVQVWKARDPRHLYTSTCHPFDLEGIDDFFVSAGGIGGMARGLAHENGKAYFTYEKTVGPFERPFISHEIGQYTSFPDLYGWFNAEKYTGPLKAHYIDLIRKRFERLHPAERGPKYAAASGALQVLQYKTELEAMLRTPSMDGYHLNGLMDYPGEGIALIGMLDAMGDSKGLITPEHFRRFCAPTVALVAMSEDEFSGGSLFEADAMVRHHGPRDLEGSRWHWTIKDRSGKALFDGDLGPHRVPTGGLTGLGRIEAKLPEVSEAQELILSLSMVDSEVMNEWSFWVFPGGADVAVPESVTLVKSWTEDARAALENGGSVVVTLNAGSLVDPVPCSFGTVFWGRGLFPRNPRPMGILCDPAQGALAGFPTRSHAQYLWYSLLTGSSAMKLNRLPFEFEPVVHMIDDFNECERLGLVLEAKVGKGRLIATSLNLGADGKRTPAQEQMLRSLLARAASAKAASPQSLTLDQLDTVFRAPRVSQLKRLGGRIAAVSSEHPGMEQAHMIDGDPQTFWHTRFAGSFAKPPHFVVLEVPAGTSVAGLTYVAYTGGNGNGHVKACAVYTSDDGKNWGEPLVKKALKAGVDADQKILFPAPTTRKFIKFEATDAVSAGGEPIAAIGELDVLLK